jgi:tetratricopeptide (TPR) repeat protein/energy-coupling factor transporter ATP-binding protein EcfA2
MQPGGDSFNPFPGLRAFEPEEDYLFFGRERAIDELLTRLRSTRFLVVTGASGSGKSSLVRSGLVPSLYRGFMAGVGSSWRVAMFRPGEDPMGRLASSVNEALGEGRSPLMTRITLERGSLGLVEAVQEARLPPNENVLVVVDQFEELFRFQSRRDGEPPGEAAIAFVKLLVEAAHQQAAPVYVVITIRADYLGQCMRFPALPEAVNAGQYLVPRMTRDELRRAITGPVAVGGGEIAPRLVVRLLNDAGDDPEQLPVLQHALMRTWDYRERHGQPDEPLDIRDYEAIGTMKNALSMHADEAYHEAESRGLAPLTQTIFKALTDTSSNPSGVRRPASVKELAAIADRPEKEILSTVEIFQRPGRSFLTAAMPIQSATIIDLSHESLMRIWVRLHEWTGQEKRSGERYVRIARAAQWFEEGTAGLWRDPELGMGLKWRSENHPTRGWAERWDPHFDLAMAFLDRSERERDRLRAAEEKARRRELTRARIWAAGLGALFIVAAAFAVYAYREYKMAGRRLALAESAVNILASLGNESSQFASEPAVVREFRARLMTNADQFYSQLRAEDPSNSRPYEALEHFHKGDIERLLDEWNQAIPEYKTAIDQFSGLARDFPKNADYRERVGLGYNWLGECQRYLGKFGDAISSYDRSLEILEKLPRDVAQNRYALELARALYNRGIAESSLHRPDQAKEDFTEAIVLLKPVAATNSDPEYRQELGRAENDLAGLIRDNRILGDARALFEDAIRLGEQLLKSYPRNREYKLELAKYHGNFAGFLEDSGDAARAQNENAASIRLLSELVAAEPSLDLELAHTRIDRAQILDELKKTEDSRREYLRALDEFERLQDRQPPADYHRLFGEALYSAGYFREQDRDFQTAARLFSRAAEEHRLAGDDTSLARDYYLLAVAQGKLGSLADQRKTIEKASGLLPHLSEADRNDLAARFSKLQSTKKEK